MTSQITSKASAGNQSAANRKQVRVSVVEDDRILRESLSGLIRRADDLELVDAYPGAESTIAGIPRLPPDVVVMDLNLAPPRSGRESGIDCVAAIKAAVPTLQVLVLTVSDDADKVFEALRAGASGYLLKRAPSFDLHETSRADPHPGRAQVSGAVIP